MGLDMKGKFIIVDLRSMDYMKNKKGEINYYDTVEEACEVCGMYEFEDAWVLELKHNHKEKLLETLSEDTSEWSQKRQDRKELLQKFQEKLDSSANKRSIAKQCVIIAEEYHQEQLSKTINKGGVQMNSITPQIQRYIELARYYKQEALKTYWKYGKENKRS